MKKPLAVFVCLLAMTVTACTPDRIGTAPRPPNVGSKHSEALQVGRAIIPLPDGEWTVMASELTPSNTSDGSMPVAMANVVLGRLLPLGTGFTLDAIIQIQSNIDQQRIVWSRDPSCARTDWLYVEDRYAQDRAQKCVYVRAWNTNFQYNENWRKIERDAVDWARANRVQLGSRTFLGTRYRVVRDTDLTIVWYYFSNSALGVMTSDNQWHAVARQNRPDFERAFKSHVDWSLEWGQKVVAGSERRLTLPSARPNVSPVSPLPVGGQDRAARLRELESLRTQGLINQQEFDSRRQRILDGL